MSETPFRELGRRTPVKGVHVSLGGPNWVFLTVCTEKRGRWLAQPGFPVQHRPSHACASASNSAAIMFLPRTFVAAFKRSLVHLVDDYLPLAARWMIWDSRVIPVKRLAISSTDGIESVRELIGA